MFDGLLKSKFYAKCKSDIKLIRTRVDLITKKRIAMQKYLRNDVYDLLRNGLHINAYGRAEGLLVEMNKTYCYEFIEQCSSLVLNHLGDMSKQRECPEDCREAVSSLMFAAARFADLPELRELRSAFSERYGSSLDLFANKHFVDKLKSGTPTKDMKLQLLQDIATESGIEWNAKALDNKLYNAPGPQKDFDKETNAKGFNWHHNNDGSVQKKGSDKEYKFSDVKEFIALDRKQDLSQFGQKKAISCNEDRFPRRKEVTSVENRLPRTVAPARDDTVPNRVKDILVDYNTRREKQKEITSLKSVLKEEREQKHPKHRPILPPYAKHGDNTADDEEEHEREQKHQKHRPIHPPYAKHGVNKADDEEEHEREQKHPKHRPIHPPYSKYEVNKADDEEEHEREQKHPKHRPIHPPYAKHGVNKADDEEEHEREKKHPKHRPIHPPNAKHGVNRADDEEEHEQKLLKYTSVPPPYTKCEVDKAESSMKDAISENSHEQDDSIRKATVPKYVRRRNFKPQRREFEGEERENSRDVNKESAAAQGQRILKYFDQGRSRPIERDEEEKMMDKLLRHYSKKRDPHEKIKSGAILKPPPYQDPAGSSKGPKHRSRDGPNQVLSFPVASSSPPETLTRHARANSFGTDGNNVHVHPKLPDYEDFVARLAELRGN